MPNHALRSTKILARTAYARNQAVQKKNQRGRGRPRLNSASQTAPLSKAKKRGTTIFKNRLRSSGGVVVKVENNSSEADCSSEGEEQDSEDEDAEEQDSNEDSHNEVESDENSANEEENSASNEESQLEILNNTVIKSESESISIKSTDDEEDENEVRYSLPSTKQDNLLKSSEKQKMIKKSSPKFSSTGGRKIRGSNQMNEENKVFFKEDEESKRCDNSSFSKNYSANNSRKSQLSKKILKEIEEYVKGKSKQKDEDDLSDESASHSAKRIKIESSGSTGEDRWNAKYKFSKRYKSFSSNFNSGKVESRNESLAKQQSPYCVSKNSPPCGNIAAEEVFRWLLNPLEPEEFFLNIFEKKPHHINRKKYSYYKELFNCDNLNTMLKENNLIHGVHIDVLKYENGERKPVESIGKKAFNSNVWEDFKQGYSVRIRNPQAYNKNIWNFCSLLQEYFSSGVGCNIYLTPPDSQGFPPHYDDIDAFIVQVEGANMWKVYPPRNLNEDLARYSSTDFQQNEIGQPMLEIFLAPGDMLYVPRGYIHQAFTGGLEHSLHLTFSTNQLNTWGDLMLQAIPKALERAILNQKEFRKAIPRDFMNYAGSTLSGEQYKKNVFLFQMRELAKVSINYLDPNEAVDMLAERFIKCSLPPVFNKVERLCSIHGNGTQWRDGEIISKNPLDLNTQIKLIRKRCMRLIIDDSGPKLFHSLVNKRDPSNPDSETLDEGYVDLDMAAVQPFTYLLQTPPNKFVKVSDLPIEDYENRIAFASSLYENGLLMTKEPLKELKQEVDWNSICDKDIPKTKEKSLLNL